MLSKSWRKRALTAGVAGIAGLAIMLMAVGTIGAAAADGTGSMTVAANGGTAATAVSITTGGQAGQAFVFTFTDPNSGGTANDYTAGSKLTLTIQSGWTAPQSTDSTAPGYVTVTGSTGSCAASLQSISGMVITVNMGCHHGNSFAINYSAVTVPVTAASTQYTFTTATDDPSSSGSGAALATANQPKVTVTTGDYMAVHMYVRECSDYAHVPSNYQATYGYSGWGTAAANSSGNDNGHHDADLGTFYGAIGTAPNVNADTGYTTGSNDAVLCDASSGTIGFYRYADTRHGGTTTNPTQVLGTVGVGTGGATVYLTADELTRARYTTWTDGLFISETNQASNLPEFTNNATTGFASMRCWTDVHFADNSEGISSSGTTHDVTCVAFNVKPEITFTSTVPANAYVGGPTYTAQATSTGTTALKDFSPVTYASATPTVCTVDTTTGVVSFVGMGTCTINANQAMQADTSTASPFWASATALQPQSFTVKGNLVITASSRTKTYGQTVNFAGTEFTTTGLASGDAVTSVTLTSTGAAAGATVAGSPYDIVVTPGSEVGTGLANYHISYAVGHLTVNKAVLNVKANDASRAYGAANPTFAATISGYVGSDTISVVTGAPSFSTTAIATSPVSGATYPITPAIGTLAAANYTFTFSNGTLTITALTSTVTVTCTSPHVYTGVAQTPCTAYVTYDGSNHPVDSADIVYGNNSNVGTGTGSYTWGGDDNHTGSNDSDTFSITPAVLTVTANDASRAYGVADPTFSAVISGYVGSDTAAVVSGSPSFSTTATSTSPISGPTYPITPAQGTLSAANYTFTYADGALTITGLPSSVTVTCTSPHVYTGSAQTPCTAVVTYDGEDHPVDSADIVYSGNTNVGTGTASYTWGGDATHSGSTNSGTFSITPAVLTVKANDASRAYGAANPTFTATISGFLGSDTASVVSGIPSFSTTATSTSPISGPTYPITPAQGTLSAANYTFTYADGTLTITARPVLTITADNKSKVFGAANPALTYHVTGLIDGDTAVTPAKADEVTPAAIALTTPPTCVTTAVDASPVGNYPISCDGAVSAKYDIQYVAGTLTVSAKPILTVSANNQSRNEGDPNPALTYGITGYDEGDTAASLTTQPTCTTTATTASLAGTYPITCSGATSDKYSIVYVGGTLTVVGSQVGGETATPGQSATPGHSATPPATSSKSDAPLGGSTPIFGLLICLAFGALGLMAVTAQRRSMRRR
ncbi:MAG TPA: MBG domain-containing protein [Candidatus Limnocylindrales bacterium]